MIWQQIISIKENSVIVQSRDGNQYHASGQKLPMPLNENHDWANVSFDDEMPLIRRVARKPPWEWYPESPTKPSWEIWVEED